MRNQFRLHQGFHYARSLKTRIETSKGFGRMQQTYPELSTTTHENYYAVANESTIDFGTFVQIMNSSSLAYNIINRDELQLKNVESIIRCFERSFLPFHSKRYFEKASGNYVTCDTDITTFEESANSVKITHYDNKTEEFDFLIDCTFGHLNVTKHFPCYFEPCLILIYRYRQRSINPPSFTIVDGEFISLLEFHDEANETTLYTLTSVKNTPFCKFTNAKAAEDFLKHVSADLIATRRRLIENDAKNFIDNFDELYEYVDFFTSCKTKLNFGVSKSRMRGDSYSAYIICLRRQDNRYISR